MNSCITCASTDLDDAQWLYYNAWWLHNALMSLLLRCWVENHNDIWYKFMIMVMCLILSCLLQTNPIELDLSFWILLLMQNKHLRVTPNLSSLDSQPWWPDSDLEGENQGTSHSTREGFCTTSCRWIWSQLFIIVTDIKTKVTSITDFILCRSCGIECCSGTKGKRFKLVRTHIRQGECLWYVDRDEIN